MARFFFSYRTTQSSTTGQTPAELFLNRRPRTRLDLLRPDLRRKTSNKQADQKSHHDKHYREREFLIGESVLVQNFRGKPKWLEATVIERTGPVSYKTQVGNEIWKRLVDQMHKRSNDDNDKQITQVNSESIREYEPTVIDVQVPVHRETTTTAGRTQQPEEEEVRVEHSTPSTNASEAGANLLMLLMLLISLHFRKYGLISLVVGCSGQPDIVNSNTLERIGSARVALRI